MSVPSELAFRTEVVPDWGGQVVIRNHEKEVESRDLCI